MRDFVVDQFKAEAGEGSLNELANRSEPLVLAVRLPQTDALAVRVSETNRMNN